MNQSILPAVMCAALALAAVRLDADDVPQERGYTPAEGALESGDAGTPVSLEKLAVELRDLGLGSTRAAYLFHNTARTAVNADCSFPVQLDFTDPQDPFVAAVLSALKPDVNFPAVRRLFAFSVQQDGTDVPVTSCQADFSGPPGGVRLRFGLQLNFAPGQRSTVVITNAMPTRSEVAPDSSAPGSPVRSTFTWKYLLDTGSGWKDAVETILLSAPVGLEQELTAPWSYAGTGRGQLFYTAADWKPEAWQDLTLTWTRTDEHYLGLWRSDALPVDPADLPAVDSPARLLGASSYLAEAADVFLPVGTWHNAPFDAARLFDGWAETAWIVRTPRGGVGEYVRFSLDSPVCRLEIANGWQRSTVDFPDKGTGSYFGKNNRVKTLVIARDDGSPLARLALADTREVQRFNVSLGPGVYRAVIADIYPGTRWNDTALGELTFVRGTSTGLDALVRDPFFSPFVK